MRIEDRWKFLERLAALEIYLTENFSQLQCVRFDLEVIYNGPANDRKLTGVVLVDTGSRSQAKLLTQRLKREEVQLAGCTLKVGAARSELNSKRNTLLRDAEKAVKAAGYSQGKDVKISWGNSRQVIVNGEVAYQQNRWEVGEAF